MVRRWAEYTREGTGTGLVGTWLLTQSTYTVLSGTPSPAEADSLRIAAAAFTRLQRALLSSARLTFTATQLTTVVVYCRCALEILAWNDPAAIVPGTTTPADSALYDVDVSAHGCSTMVQYGRRTGETVTRHWFGGLFSATLDPSHQSGVVYSSSDTSHASTAVYDMATEAAHCPNEPPTWYAEFLASNARDSVGLVKSASSVFRA